MSISKILKYVKLKSELSTDELKLADLLVAITESDRLAIIELWGMKPTKSTKPATGRKIEYCAAEGCGFTKRAVVHKDSSVNGYHEFQQPSSSSKSKRASSLAGAIKGTTGGTAGVAALHKPVLCVFEIDGKVCHGTENDAIHDATMGYAAYHEFQPEQTLAASGD